MVGLEEPQVLGGDAVGATREATRGRILAVALELIADRGFAATTTREIAERLGFTKAALYYHYRTKDDLLAALVGPAMEELARLVERALPRPSPSARRRVLEGYLDLVVSQRELIRVLADDPSAHERPAIRAVAPLADRLVRLLAGTPVPDTAQRTRVRAALGAVHTAVLRAEPGDDPAVVRATALVAACGALGIPGPRPDAAV